MASSTSNYTLGKGLVSFNPYVNGAYQGALIFGNCVNFDTTIELSKLDHYSSKGGLKKKDFEVISEVSANLEFSLDEMNADNLALMSMATKTTETQVGAEITGEEHIGTKDRKVKLDNRNILTSITFSQLVLTAAPTTEATRGQIITDDTTGATATVYSFTTDTYEVYNVVGAFGASSTLTANGGVATNAGTVDATSFFTTDSSATAQTLTVTGATSGLLTISDDYSISVSEKDDEVGRVYIASGGAVIDGEVLTFVYSSDTVEYTKLNALNETSIIGKVIFSSDNPIGNDLVFTAHKVSLTPNGSSSFIGDEIIVMGLTGEILDDSENNPIDPYYTIQM